MLSPLVGYRRLSREHHAIFVVLCHSILLFDPRREHSSVPTAYPSPSRAAAVVGRAMIRGEPAIGRDQSREPRLYSVEPVWGPDHEAPGPRWRKAPSPASMT